MKPNQIIHKTYNSNNNNNKKPKVGTQNKQAMLITQIPSFSSTTQTQMFNIIPPLLVPN
jgi:hypothetical protein